MGSLWFFSSKLEWFLGAKQHDFYSSPCSNIYPRYILWFPIFSRMVSSSLQLLLGKKHNEPSLIGWLQMYQDFNRTTDTFIPVDLYTNGISGTLISGSRVQSVIFHWLKFHRKRLFSHRSEGKSRSLELVHLIPESLYPLTSSSRFPPPSGPLATTFLESRIFWLV